MSNLDEKAPNIWGAKLGPGQPVVKTKGHRYADFVWPEDKYPAYVSGGGFLMNWETIKVLHAQIPENPITPIDDAFLGICFKKAGFEKNVHQAQDIFKSWGFGKAMELYLYIIYKIKIYFKYCVAF